jgi:hypothetical protein
MLFDNQKVALLTALCFILFFEIPTWNSYILAESIYASFTCFSILMLIRLKRNQRFYFVIPAILVVLFTSVVKPTGIALFSASLIAVLYNPISNLSKSWMKWGICLLTITILLILANRMLVTYTVMEIYEKGEVIYAITTLPYKPEYAQLVVSPPKSLYLPPPNDQPLFKIVKFMVYNPLYWSRLFLTKIFFLLSHIRPYWSNGHNIFSLAFLLPMYFSFFMGIRRLKEDFQMIIFTCAYLFIHIVSVGVTSEDWDGRFLVPLLPVILLFSLRGISLFLRSEKNTRMNDSFDGHI